MKPLQIEKVKIDLNTGMKIVMVAEVQEGYDVAHSIYSLTYECYRSPWVAKGEAKP